MERHFSWEVKVRAERILLSILNLNKTDQRDFSFPSLDIFLAAISLHQTRYNLGHDLVLTFFTTITNTTQ